MTPVSTLLAIDPGTKKLGWAFFASGMLVRCGTSRVTGTCLGDLAARHAANLPSALEGICELMTVYAGASQKGDQNDLVRVATVGAQVVAIKTDMARFVEPRTWKGQVPKGIHHDRIREKLKDVEKMVAKNAAMDTMDAIGLGLYHLGR